MNVKTALEALRKAPRDETQLRWMALELGGSLAELKDEELVQLGSGLARIEMVDPEAPPFVQGFRSALSTLLSGMRQQRQRVREQRAQERELEQGELEVRQAWRRLLPAMLQETFQQKKLVDVLGMHSTQVSRNVNAMMKAGLLEEVPMQESVEAAAHDKRVHLYRLTAAGRQLAELITARTPEPAPMEPVKPALPGTAEQGHEAVVASALHALRKAEQELAALQTAGWPSHASVTHAPAWKPFTPARLGLPAFALSTPDCIQAGKRVTWEKAGVFLVGKAPQEEAEHDRLVRELASLVLHPDPEPPPEVPGEGLIFLNTPSGAQPLQLKPAGDAFSGLPLFTIKHRSAPVTHVDSGLSTEPEGDE